MPARNEKTQTKLEATNRLSIQYRLLAELKVNPKNPRIHADQQVHQIALSIRTFGFVVPVLIDSGSNVIAGHGRLAAAKLIGLNELPTICLEHLTAVQVAAFMVADNRLSEIAVWDDRLLAEQLKALSEADIEFSIEVTGFNVAEIDLLIEGLARPGGDGGDPGDLLPKSVANPVARVGDLWLLGRNRVVCGDSLKADTYSQLVDGARANAVFTDPPFNLVIDQNVVGFGKTRYREFAMASGEMNEREFTEFLNTTFNNLVQNSLDGSLHFHCIDWRHLPELLTAGRAAYSEFKNLCVWVKESGGQGSLYRSQHELIAVFKNGSAAHRNNIQLGQYGRYRTNVWEYPRVSCKRSKDDADPAEHPTIKPIALVSDAILDCTARNEIVLDPFLGSGTSVVAAERTGRICYGIEIDPTYIDTAIRRWERFTSKQAIHASSGKTFSEIEKELANGQ